MLGASLFERVNTARRTMAVRVRGGMVCFALSLAVASRGGFLGESDAKRRTVRSASEGAFPRGAWERENAECEAREREGTRRKGREQPLP